MLIMNAIVFYNKAVFGERIENDLDGVTMHPAFWQYINFIGKYSVYKIVNFKEKWDKSQLVNTVT
jgi:hypothetical protein